ncbi:hypothetical protein [Weissella cibaria]|uniref:hypothetical protein n=1 Tax=Weissella cibaria TaxID=137591 RepID=UPI00106E2612|nr:hypothetical protein [Weissella cibaria]
MFAYQENKVGLNKWGGLRPLALLVGQFWINTSQMRATMGDDGVLREHQRMLIGLAMVMYMSRTLLLGLILWGVVMLVRPQWELMFSGVLLCNQLVWLPFGVESVVLLLMRQQERVTSVEIVLSLLAIGLFGWLTWQLKILRTWCQLTIIAILMAVIAFAPNVLSCT